MDNRASAVPKRIKRLLREHAAVAHEEELRRALVPLTAAIRRWEKGEMSSAEISEIIHEFHQGPAPELYARSGPQQLKSAVAHAIASGVLKRAEVPADLLEHLAGAIEYSETEASRK